MEQKKLLSVILPCYNEEKVITKTRKPPVTS